MIHLALLIQHGEQCVALFVSGSIGPVLGVKVSFAKKSCREFCIVPSVNYVQATKRPINELSLSNFVL